MCQGKSLYIWLMQIIGLLGLIVLCLWLSLRPKNPSYSIVFISIEQPSNSNENGTIFYNLEIENPNKDSSIYYEDTILSFLYGQEEDEVGETTIGSFHQGTGNTRDVSDTVNAKPRPLKPLLNASTNATAELKVALMTRYRYKTWGIKSKFHGLHLRGILPIDSDGKLSRFLLTGVDTYWQLVSAIGELKPAKHESR
ncbi:NDR1 protein [Spatholobus suberectus]|nr:NDR1 protein [Spatholobus suberectus]